MSIERDQIRVMMVLGVTMAVFILAFWLPNHLHENRLHAELDVANKSLHQVNHNPQALAGMMRQVTDLRMLTHQSQKYVPQTDELADLLRKLSMELRDQQVIGQEVQTGSIVHGDKYSVIPITLRFQGSFPAVFGFLQRIESMRRMIRITRLEIDGDAQRVNQPLSVRVELYTFFMKPQGGKP